MADAGIPGAVSPALLPRMWLIGTPGRNGSLQSAEKWCVPCFAGKAPRTCRQIDPGGEARYSRPSAAATQQWVADWQEMLVICLPLQMFPPETSSGGTG